MRKPVTRSLLALVLALAGLVQVHAQKPAVPPRRIAVFGSSVANGTGDDIGHEGYTGRLRELLAPRGWEILNQSRGGDNTKTMAPRFAPIGEPDPKVRYLLTGQSRLRAARAVARQRRDPERHHQGGEGRDLHPVRNRDARFVARSREHHIVPIITLCYTRNDFTSVESPSTRRMNLAMNGWDVPSVNFLGAVDDGTGKWAKGFWHDSLHPNAAGHDELLRTFVPTLFEALERASRRRSGPRPAASRA